MSTLNGVMVEACALLVAMGPTSETL